jgi:voltage-gated potassium channel
MSGKIVKNRELKDAGYELFIGALSLLTIFNLVFLYLGPEVESLAYVIGAINALMLPIFLGDFLYRFFTSDDRWGYFFRGYGWADLLSSVPVPQFKVLRLARLWRVIPLFVEFGIRNLVREFLAHRAENALLTVIFLVICVLEFGSISIIRAESASADANIQTASDALWWTYVTITTVGYGDRYPVTNAGRVVALFVMTAGVGLFGTLSGFLANKLLAPPEEQEETGTLDADDPKARIAELRRMLDAQEVTTAFLKAKLDQIEELL